MLGFTRISSLDFLQKSASRHPVGCSACCLLSLIMMVHFSVSAKTMILAEQLLLLYEKCEKIMGCKKHDGKKCLFRHIFCFKDDVLDRYIISCPEERELKKEGRKDAKNNSLKKKAIDGFDYHYTDNINKLLKKFVAIASDEYKNNYIENLNNLNKSISVCMINSENQERISTNDIKNLLIQRTNAIRENNARLVNVIERNIRETINNCSNTIAGFNKEGRENMAKALNILNTYDNYFETELNFCVSKIQIYWNSFYNTLLKQCNKYVDIKLPDNKTLMIISDIENPAKNFNVNKYVETNPEEKLLNTVKGGNAHG